MERFACACGGRWESEVIRMIKLIRRIFKRKKPVAQAEGRDWSMAVIHGYCDDLRPRKADEMIFWR